MTKLRVLSVCAVPAKTCDDGPACREKCGVVGRAQTLAVKERFHVRRYVLGGVRGEWLSQIPLPNLKIFQSRVPERMAEAFDKRTQSCFCC